VLDRHDHVRLIARCTFRRRRPPCRRGRSSPRRRSPSTPPAWLRERRPSPTVRRSCATAPWGARA
jgi:hypothetical protein